MIEETLPKIAALMRAENEKDAQSKQDQHKYKKKKVGGVDVSADDYLPVFPIYLPIL